MNSVNQVRMLAVSLALGMSGPFALAQDGATPPPVKPADQSPAPATPPEQPPESPLPDLDDLLGTKPKEPGDPARDPSKEDLERKLRGEEVADAFKQAVGFIGRAADRLENEKDRGLRTQRLQEDAIRKLDELIAALQQQQQQGRSRSRPQPNEEPQETPSNQRSQQRQNSQNQGENTSEAEPPARQDGELNPELQAARASWGALPPRLRDMLMQGSSDQFSSMYQQMTERYYRRLAEEGSGR